MAACLADGTKMMPKNKGRFRMGRREARIVLLSALLGFISASGACQSGAVSSASPEVTIQVFSDFQCPYCRMFAPAVRALAAKGVEGVRTKVEFRNFPLGFHSFAQLAAQAAMAAGEQGKFWEMHDLLFSHQNALGREDLLKYAQSLNLNMEQFRRDLDSDRIKKRVAADKAEGDAKKVQGTPTFFVNGKEYSGTKSLEELSGLVRADAGRRIALSEISDASLRDRKSVV